MRSQQLGVRLGLAALALASCQFAPSGDAAPADDDDDDGVGVDGRAPDDGTPPTDAAAAAVDARPPCPADYTVAVGGARYVRRATAAFIGAARTDCADDLAGRTGLATFEAAGALPAVLASVDAPDDEPLWVGATCAFGMFGCDGAATWSWDSGAPIPAALWADGEPNNGFRELSAIALHDGTGWALASTGTVPVERHPYVCACRE